MVTSTGSPVDVIGHKVLGSFLSSEHGFKGQSLS